MIAKRKVSKQRSCRVAAHEEDRQTLRATDCPAIGQGVRTSPKACRTRYSRYRILRSWPLAPWHRRSSRHTAGWPLPKAQAWGRERRLLSPAEFGVLGICTKMPARLPTERQANMAVSVLARLEENAFIRDAAGA